MLANRTILLAALTAGAVGVLGGATAQAAGPPAPVSTTGKKVHQLAFLPAPTGQSNTPTSWGFLGKQAFVGAFGVESEGEAPPADGGLYYLKNGDATLVPGSASSVFGVTTHRKTLYTASSAFGAKGIVSSITRWRGWNGSSFAHHKVIWTSPKNFSSLNGLAWVHGRIYAGVGLSDNNDHGPAQTKYEYDVISVKANGTDTKIVAKGMRQPFQFTSVGKRRYPLVSVLGQDKPNSTKAPDFLAVAKPGADYGFQKCNWTKPGKCTKYDTPFKFLPAHFSPMGLGAKGSKIYIAAFGGKGKAGPGVYEINRRGGHLKQLVQTFAPNITLGAHGGWLYFGGVTGVVYRVHR
jgi:hypothetical protein